MKVLTNCFFEIINLSFLEDFLVLLLVYNFVKFLLLSLILELLWPSLYFNKKNSSGYSLLRYRSYTEVILKLRNNTETYYLYNFLLIVYYL